MKRKYRTEEQREVIRNVDKLLDHVLLPTYSDLMEELSKERFLRMNVDLQNLKFVNGVK